MATIGPPIMAQYDWLISLSADLTWKLWAYYLVTDTSQDFSEPFMFDIGSWNEFRNLESVLGPMTSN